MDNAILKDNPTDVQRVQANRGKRLNEAQIRNSIQKEADIRRVITELEVGLLCSTATLNGNANCRHN